MYVYDLHDSGFTHTIETNACKGKHLGKNSKEFIYDNLHFDIISFRWNRN